LGRECLVCLSPYCKEYEDLRFNKRWSVRKIYEYARVKHGETFSYQSLRRHLKKQKHYINQMKEVDAFREEIIKQEIDRELEASRILRNNLELLSEQVQAVLQDGTNIQDPEARKEIREIVSKINQTSDLLLRFSDKINIKDDTLTEDELYRRVMLCMEDFPIEYIKKFKNRWDVLSASRNTHSS